MRIILLLSFPRISFCPSCFLLFLCSTCDLVLDHGVGICVVWGYDGFQDVENVDLLVIDLEPLPHVLVHQVSVRSFHLREIFPFQEVFVQFLQEEKDKDT